jgi:hypothetical protein
MKIELKIRVAKESNIKAITEITLLLISRDLVEIY